MTQDRTTPRHGPMAASADTTSPVLSYQRRPAERPRWVARLGVGSIVVGTLGMAGGIPRGRDAWAHVFDPTYRWLYPPPPAVDALYLAAVLGGAACSVLLVLCAVMTLAKPHQGMRLHLWYAALAIPMVAIRAALRQARLWSHPDFSATMLLIDALVECALLGVYPLFILLLVRCKARQVQECKVN